jgi:hypothetical protein
VKGLITSCSDVELTLRWPVIGNSDSETMKVEERARWRAQEESHSVRIRSGCRKQSLSLRRGPWAALSWLDVTPVSRGRTVIFDIVEYIISTTSTTFKVWNFQRVSTFNLTCRHLVPGLPFLAAFFFFENKKGEDPEETSKIMIFLTSDCGHRVDPDFFYFNLFSISATMDCAGDLNT